MMLKARDCKKETLIFGGSTAFAPLIVAAADEFSKRACARAVFVRNEGSWAGIADVLAGAADAAVVDFDFHDARGDLVSYPVAAFAIAFVVNPAARVSGVTMSQLCGILSGRIRNWSEAGGADCEIQVVNRSAASGIRSIVEERVLSNRSVVESNRCVESNRAAALTVELLPGAFSYVALPGVRDLDVIALAIDDVPPDIDRVLAGVYPFWTCGRVLVRPNMLDLALRFVDHVVEDTDACDVLGYIRLNRMSTNEERLYASARVGA